jgi:hypothetical protein
VEVVNPAAPGGALSQPFGVSPEALRATQDPGFAATHPEQDPRKPYPGYELSYRAGHELGNLWQRGQSNNMSSDAIGGVAGAGATLGLTYLIDALRRHVFGASPMSGMSRTALSLAGGAGGAVLNHSMRAGMKTGSAAWGEGGFGQDRMRQQLASQILASSLPYDLKSRILRELDQMGGSELSNLARIAAPLAGGMAGAAIAKYIFGDSVLPELIGGFLGFRAGRSAMSSRVNAMGAPMIL